uniref:Uncharacterized protein n=1 Tax=Salix viminalis TaxID=40686 RepID=A0A6N2LYL1_SALVM
MVAMANTAVIVTGAPGNRSGWVRSNIAREKGLMRSYFERIRDSQPYRSLHPKFIKQLVDPESKSFDSYSYAVNHNRTTKLFFHNFNIIMPLSHWISCKPFGSVYMRELHDHTSAVIKLKIANYECLIIHNCECLKWFSVSL